MEDEPSVEQMIPGLTQLSMYYNQTLLSACDTCDSMNHKNPTSPLNTNTNRLTIDINTNAPDFPKYNRILLPKIQRDFEDSLVTFY